MKDNELIAEFMGGKWETVWCGGVETKAFNFPGWHITDWPHTIHDDTFRYHSSWDWLMPVVEKIRGLKLCTNHNFNPMTNVEYFSIYDHEYMNTAKGQQFYAEGSDCVYKAVVKFIKWYNSQKPG